MPATKAARNKAIAKYIKNHTRRFTIQCNNEKDADIIEYLENCDNATALIKRLVREEIARGANNEVDLSSVHH